MTKGKVRRGIKLAGMGNALGIIMPRLGFQESAYIDRVPQYGNMVSALVLYALCEQGRPGSADGDGGRADRELPAAQVLTDTAGNSLKKQGGPGRMKAGMK